MNLLSIPLLALLSAVLAIKSAPANYGNAEQIDLNLAIRSAQDLQDMLPKSGSFITRLLSQMARERLEHYIKELQVVRQLLGGQLFMMILPEEVTK